MGLGMLDSIKLIKKWIKKIFALRFKGFLKKLN
jgi:hypothetical protein